MTAAPMAVAPYARHAVDESELVDEWLKAIGGELAKARSDKGISQKDMADRLELGRSTVSKIERGLNPTFPNYLRYAIDLDVDFAVIAARARLIVKTRDIDDSLLEV